jgi:timeless
LEAEWDARISSNLSVVLANEINLPEDEHPKAFDSTLEVSDDEQRCGSFDNKYYFYSLLTANTYINFLSCRANCKLRIRNFLHDDEDFERAVLLLRAARNHWEEADCFGSSQPEDELLTLKEIYLSDSRKCFH